jgi:hypothetical protein
MIQNNSHDVSGQLTGYLYQILMALLSLLENTDSEVKIWLRKQSAINQISVMISEWAKILDLEHFEYPNRFDLNRLTVMVDRNRPVPLQQLGSGANRLGCHLVVLFALHTFMHKNKRPIPGFLFLDKPSQVFFPPETNNIQVDNREIRKVYRFIFDKIKELYPNMQVIIIDHADIMAKQRDMKCRE